MPKKDKVEKGLGNVASPEIVVEPEPIAPESIAPDVAVFPAQVTVYANRLAFFEVRVSGAARPLEVAGPEWLQVTGAPLELAGEVTLTLSAVYGHDAPAEGELVVGNAVVRVALAA